MAELIPPNLRDLPRGVPRPQQSPPPHPSVGSQWDHKSLRCCARPSLP